MEFFDGTIRSQVQDFLHGKNALVFSYGVTNAGKTHTIQGMKKYSGALSKNSNAECLAHKNGPVSSETVCKIFYTWHIMVVNECIRLN